jgi:D-inositol-3-phosphate glycosyltransferase
LKKRIGVVMYQTSKSKGQELVAQRMVAYFKKLGHDAYLITSVYHDGREVVDEDVMGDKGYTHVQDSELGIPVIRVASFVSKWPPRRIVFKDVVHSLERIVNDFELNVLITHSTLWNGPEEVAKFIEWRRNMETLGGFKDPIVFCHMSHFQEPSPRRYSLVERSFRMAWNRLALATILRVANLILVVTPYEEDAKVKMGASHEKCLLFPGGVDDDAFARYASSDPDEFLQYLKLKSDTKVVSYLGTIEERKNPKAVLEVAERLKERPGIHFVIAGRGDSQYAFEVQARLEKLPNVTYLGEIDEREKAQLTRVSYLNISLSRMEALGLAQLEFMFQGVPVITSAVGGQSWLIKNGEDGVHVKGPDDIQGTIQAITELVDDPSRRQKLSASAKEKATPFALSRLIANLDSAITNELERESGLSGLPSEVRSTLSEPEIVARTWSRGTQKVVATNKRVFIQRGRLSRETLEIPYTNIKSIAYIRRYQWKTILIGILLTALIFVQHYLFPIVSRTVTARIDELIVALIPDKILGLQQEPVILTLLPATVAFLFFLNGARRGFALQGAALTPVYLPQSFAEAVTYIRKMQDQPRPGKTAEQQNE